MSERAGIDIFIIGGGINGCGIARDAVGRGYSVALAEMNDLASGTSSGSTKLVHGGLRYLEHYEFRLVREALLEREVLWSIAPHIIWPLRFVLPHLQGMRPAWLLRLGLFLYDNLGGRKLLPGTRTIDLSSDLAGSALKPGLTKAFEYSDCWVNDARLVVLNARDAADRGAKVMTRTKVVSAERDGSGWTINVEGPNGPQAYHARVLVNAAGPWVDRVLNTTFRRNDARNVRLVQGSHIVVKRLFEHDRCYIFQNADGRIVFAIPYEQDFTLIGTTDRDYSDNPSTAKISPVEIDYLCAAASSYFSQTVSSDDIVWTYSAVRPLFDDGASKAQEATRDYVLKVESDGNAPLINIFGGKITTYRRLAESALIEIGKAIGSRGKPWTDKSPLPGGNFHVTEFDSQVSRLMGDYPFLTKSQATRLVRLYGTISWHFLGKARTADDLGTDFGADLTEAEVRYLMTKEWAVTAEDVLWRRTKRGLLFSNEEVKKLQSFMNAENEKLLAKPVE